MTLGQQFMTAARRWADPTDSSDPLRAPSPPGEPVLGHLRLLMRSPPRFLLRSCVEHGDVVRLHFGNPLRRMTAHLISAPDDVRRVLQDQHRTYSKRTRGIEKLRIFLGNGLLTSEGDFWLRQRRIAQPAFHRDRIASFGGAMTRAAGDMLERRWAQQAASGQPFDVATEMMRLTLRVVSETLFGADVSGDADAVGEAVGQLLHEAMRVIEAWVDLPMTLPTPGNRRLQAAMATVDEVVMRVIAERRRAADPGSDLLAMLMRARDEETGESMSDRQLRDEVVTMFLAGHETTANALSWALYLLAMHPGEARKLRVELREVLGGRPPTIEDVPRLVQTRAVIQETMRLYPPAWITTRRVEQEDMLGGYRVPAESVVFVSPYVIHRSPRLWKNPEGFDPDRFLPERAASIPRLAYLPFGAGPRQCIGNGFAMLEAQLILATIVQRAELELVPGRVVEVEPVVTLRPKGGLAMVVRMLSAEG
jgi:cytochrome P450